MPEMADVEVLKRYFNEELRAETITGVQVLNPALIKMEDLEEKLTGGKIREARRYAKYLFLKFDAAGWFEVSEVRGLSQKGHSSEVRVK